MFINFFKSLLFVIFVWISAIPLTIAFIFSYPLFFLKNRRKLFDSILVLWGKYVLFCLKICVGIRANIIGYEKLDRNKRYLFVCKHESLWESFVFHTFMKPVPCFILKKEMLKVPFFGWHLSNATCIPIDREEGIFSLKKIVKESKIFLNLGHNIIIFPQGTRVPYDSNIKQYPYKIGFTVLAKELGVDVVPVALNSGKLWKTKQFVKHKGIITMKFLDPISYSDIKKMKNNEIISLVQDKIENTCEKLNEL